MFAQKETTQHSPEHSKRGGVSKERPANGVVDRYTAPTLQRHLGNGFLQASAEHQSSSDVPNLRSQNTVLQRECACGGMLKGEGCDECNNQLLTLQHPERKKTENREVPPIVYEVLDSEGQPLDPETRTDMESEFDEDFSHVRIHTDARASESAKAVDALAYTVGSKIVFGSGQYTPETISGRKIITHELAHVIQQRNALSSVPIMISASNSALEEEANKFTEIISQENSRSEIHEVTDSVSLQRLSSSYTPIPTIEPLLGRNIRPQRIPTVRRAPTRQTPARLPERLPKTEYWKEDGEEGTEEHQRNLNKSVEPKGERYAPDIDDIFERIKQNIDDKNTEDYILDQEQPIATLMRGGSPPDFITIRDRVDEIDKFGTLSYYRRFFHILDAIEYKVGKSKTPQELRIILRDYLTPIYYLLQEEEEPYYKTIMEPIPLIMPTIPEDIDPGCEKRLDVFLNAIPKHLRTEPSVAADLALLEEPEEKDKKRRKGYCCPKAYPYYRNKYYAPIDPFLIERVCSYRTSVVGMRDIDFYKNIACGKVRVEKKEGSFEDYLIGVNIPDTPIHSEDKIIEQMARLARINPRSKIILTQLFSERVPCKKCQEKLIDWSREEPVLDLTNVLIWYAIPSHDRDKETRSNARFLKNKYYCLDQF